MESIYKPSNLYETIED